METIESLSTHAQISVQISVLACLQDSYYFYIRDDNTSSLQSIGKKTSKELTLPQEKTVLFKAERVVSLQMRNFSAALPSTERMGSRNCCGADSQVTGPFLLPHSSSSCTLGSSIPGPGCQPVGAATPSSSQSLLAPSQRAHSGLIESFPRLGLAGEPFA